MGFESFNQARETLSLKEIKEQIKKDTENKIDKLKIEIELINVLYSDKGLIVKEGDELDYIKALTSKGNKLEWIDQKEADLIHHGDIIRIELEGTDKIITKNGNKIGKVISGFDKKNELVKPTPVKPEKENIPKEKPKSQKKEVIILKPEVIPKEKITIQEQPKITSPELLPNEVVLQHIENAFDIFKETIQKIDTTLDVKSSKEKKGQKEYLDVQFNVLINLLSEQQNNTSPELQNRINEIKIYLATYYADEGSVENSNFSNYKLSNELAFQVLGEINGQKPPKAPDMQNILGSFKGTGIGTYITTQLKNGETVTDIFENNIVKNATKEEGDKLMEQYEDNLDNYLNNADNNKNSLNENQKQALNLLMDVNGVGFFNIKNSTTDMFDIMGWDFAAIGVGIGTGAGVGTLVGGPVGFVGGAIAGGATATIGMMLNHGDNYFSEDWKKGLTEFGINSATFGFGGAVFKGARALQVSYGLKVALPAEMIADVTIGTTADITRGWAYDMNIELGDAIINNLVWALLPIAFNGKQIFSSARKRLATEVTETQQKASILSKLGDKIGAKKLIKGLSEKIKNLRNKVEQNLEKSTYKTELGAENALHQLKLNNPNKIYTLKEINGRYKIVEVKKTSESSISSKAESKETSTRTDKNKGEIISKNKILKKSSKSINEILAKFTDNFLVKGAWDILSKELKPTRKLHVPLTFPANIMRLPLINSRKIAELWFTKGDKGFKLTGSNSGQNRLLDSIKVLFTSSSEPFANKLQTFATFLVVATVASITYDEILETNPNTPADIVWGSTWRFIKNMNLDIPIEVIDYFMNEEIELPKI